MAVTVKKVTLWRGEVENQPGLLARTLQPFANAGIDLQVVMGYRYPGNETRAAVEVYPVSSKKSVAAAQSAGLSVSSIPSLMVEGDNRVGLGYVMAKAIAEAGINMSFLVAQVVGRKYSALLGFESDTDRDQAAALLRKAVKARKK